MTRPITTLFMLMSVDGKITPGTTDDLDFDKDLPCIPGLKEGLQQYYDIEQTTDLWSLNSGRVQTKMGVNEKELPAKTPVSFVLIDNHHLTENGVRYFCALSKEFVLVTTNKEHPALGVNEPNLHIIQQDKLDLRDMLRQLKENYGCERITIQTGGTLNGMFLREKLFDYVDIVVAPLLVGGIATSTLVDGDAILAPEQLHELGVLELESVMPLNGSYIRLKYKVVS